jgi:hypothetical protein
LGLLILGKNIRSQIIEAPLSETIIFNSSIALAWISIFSSSFANLFLESGVKEAGNVKYTNSKGTKQTKKPNNKHLSKKISEKSKVRCTTVTTEALENELFKKKRREMKTKQVNKITNRN